MYVNWPICVPDGEIRARVNNTHATRCYTEWVIYTRTDIVSSCDITKRFYCLLIFYLFYDCILWMFDYCDIILAYLGCVYYSVFYFNEPERIWMYGILLTFLYCTKWYWFYYLKLKKCKYVWWYVWSRMYGAISIDDFFCNYGTIRIILNYLIKNWAYYIYIYILLLAKQIFYLWPQTLQPLRVLLK